MTGKGGTALSREEIFRDALLLGVSFGLLHAVVESTLLGWYGVPFSALDLAIFAAAWVALFLVAGAAVGVATSVRRLRGVFGDPNSLAAARKLTWTLLLVVYCLLFLKILSYWSGWATALKWSILAAPIVLVCWRIVARRPETALVLTALTAVSLTLNVLQLLYAEWIDIPDSNRLTLALSLALPIGSCLAALLFLARVSSPKSSPFRPWAALVVAGALCLGLWSTVLPRPARSRIVRSALPAEPAKGRLNFILIVLDTVRADRLDLFGYEEETMPNLRRFAREEGRSANLMVTTSPWTLPSHASMFTGLYPSAHGAHYPFVADTEFRGVAYPLREDVPTLAEFLSELGYETAGIVANGGFLSAFGMPRGFQSYDTTPSLTSLGSRTAWLSRLRVGNRPSLFDRIRGRLPGKLSASTRYFAPLHERSPDAREITDRARDWLGQRGGRPFFLFLNYLDAHVPYRPHPDGAAPPAPELASYEFSMDRFRACQRGSDRFSPEELDVLERLYDGELRYLDRELGRLFDALEGSPFYDDTMILITTDHGEAFFDDGYVGHGNDLHVEETGGFLILKVPASLGPVEPSPVMQFVDFLPTIAAALNEPIPAHIQGSPWGKGRDFALSEVFCLACSGENRTSHQWPENLRRDAVAVAIGDRKLVRSTHGPDRVYEIAGHFEELDPSAAADGSFHHRVEAILAERDERTFKGRMTTGHDERLMERLRSLGYVP